MIGLAKSTITDAVGPQLNSGIGPVGEVGVAYQLIRRGWSVYTAIVADTLQHYDLIACKGEVMQRIQVKCTSKIERNTSRYSILAAKGNYKKVLYTKDECDFIIASLNPIEWYFIFPVEDIPALTLRFPANFPPDHRYSRYKDAWHLLESQKNPHQQTLVGGD